MRIAVTGSRVELQQVDDLLSFDVVTDHLSVLDRALRAAGAGRFNEEHAWIHRDWLISAAGQRTEQWTRDFSAMIEFAFSNGWTDPASGDIRAHVHSARNR